MRTTQLMCLTTCISLMFIVNIIAQNNKNAIITDILSQAQIHADSSHYLKAIMMAKEVEASLLQQKKKKNVDDLIWAYSIIGQCFSKVQKDSLTTYLQKINAFKNVKTDLSKARIHALNAVHQLVIHRSFEVAEKEYEQAIQLYPQEHPEKVRLLSNLGYVKHCLNKLEASLEYYQASITLGSKVLHSAHPVVSPAFNNRGILYMQRGQYSRALEDFQTSLDIRLTLLDPNALDVFASQVNIGIIFSYQKEGTRAVQYFQRALAIAKANKYTDYIPVIYNNMAMAIYPDQPEESIRYYQEALRYDKGEISVMANQLNRGTLYYGIAINYRVMEDYNQAIHYLDKALEYANDRIKILIYINFAAIYITQKKYEEAEIALLEAERISETFQGTEDQMIADVYYHFALIKYDKRAYEAALTYNQKAAKFLNYELDNDFERVFAPNSLIVLLLQKGDIYMKLAISDDTKFQNAIDAYQQAWNLSNYVQNTYQAVEDKQKFIAAAKSTIEKNMEAYLANENTNKQEIFNFLERSRASLLHEAIKENEALSVSGIPNDLLLEEYRLKLEISNYNSKRQDFLSKGTDEEDIDFVSITTKLIELREAHETLKTQFERDYLAYYGLKYEQSTLSMMEVQSDLLNENQTMLEYFVGDSAIYIFLINKDDYDIKVIKKDFPLEDWVRDFREANNSKLYTQKSRQYTESAYQLYQKLIAPVQEKLKEELIIIPDGVLGYIPFEALLVEPVVKPVRFRQHHYLLRDKQISYAYSATLLQQMRSKQHKDETAKGLLAFAPYYDKDTTMLANLFRYADENDKAPLKPLPNSGEEVYGIQKLVGGKVYYHQEATEARFWEEAKDYRFLHLATHGKANDKTGDYSFLAFTEQKDSLENELLFVRDLYNLQLNADMVVLSACETGIGELQRGEGIISLARGFTYAGAKSIFTTLWSVQDKSSKDLMLLFYKHLKAGMPKDKALRQAKLNYLDSLDSNPLAHPFHWSGFIGIGDMSPVKF